MDSDPPRSLRFFRVGCELCDRGDLEEGLVLLSYARTLAEKSGPDAFTRGLLEQIEFRLESRAETLD